MTTPMKAAGLEENCVDVRVSGRRYGRTTDTDRGVSDEMIARASIPNAAALLRRATKKGLISPVSGYAAGPA